MLLARSQIKPLLDQYLNNVSKSQLNYKLWRAKHYGTALHLLSLQKHLTLGPEDK